MSTTVEQAVRRMDQLTGTVIAATAQEMRAAAYAIARQTKDQHPSCLLYTSPSPRDRTRSRMPSSA